MKCDICMELGRKHPLSAITVRFGTAVCSDHRAHMAHGGSWAMAMAAARVAEALDQEGQS